MFFRQYLRGCEGAFCSGMCLCVVSENVYYFNHKNEKLTPFTAWIQQNYEFFCAFFFFSCGSGGCPSSIPTAIHNSFFFFDPVKKPMRLAGSQFGMNKSESSFFPTLGFQEWFPYACFYPQIGLVSDRNPAIFCYIAPQKFPLLSEKTLCDVENHGF